MNKIILALFVVGFWLFLPIPFMLMEVTGYEEVDFTDLEKADNPTIINSISIGWKFVTFYFKTIVYTLPEVDAYINYFLLFIKLASITFVVIMLRGN